MTFVIATITFVFTHLASLLKQLDFILVVGVIVTGMTIVSTIFSS